MPSLRLNQPWSTFFKSFRPHLYTLPLDPYPEHLSIQRKGPVDRMVPLGQAALHIACEPPAAVKE